MTAPITTTRTVRRPARRSLRSAPRLLAASRRLVPKPHPRRRPVAPLENGNASGPPSAPSPEVRASLATLRPWALKMARYFGARADDREDVVHDAFVRAARDLGYFLAPLDVPRETALRRWIVGILANVVLEHQRRARRASKRSSGVAPDDLDAERGDHGAAVEARADLRRILQAFPAETSPERWRAWLASEVDGVPVAEIARQEGSPESTIYNRLRLAREDLAAMLSRHEATARGKLARDRMKKGRR